MIASLSGEINEKLTDRLILEVNGIGYSVFMSPFEFDRVVVGDICKLYIYENIKEDAYDLYGFSDKDTKKLFEHLISVKNVGPKVGLAILSIGTADKVRAAIAGGDVKTLTTAKGVGKRAAEQLVVELRDKVGLITANEAEQLVTRSAISPNDEAVQALIALGYSETDAANSLQDIDPSLDLHERIKLALKGGK